MTLQSTIGPAVLVTLLTAACAPAPRSRPVEGGPVAAGAGTLTEARKFLEGNWTLESFQVFPPGKPPMMLKGTGLLSYDDFGNLKMEIRPDREAAGVLQDAGIELTDGAISSNGRTAVDLQRKSITYVLEGQPANVTPTGPLSPGVPRFWEVTGDVLTLTTRNEAGNPTSVGRWRRVR